MQNKTIPIWSWSSDEQVSQIDAPEFLVNTKIKSDIVKRVVDWQLAGRRSGCHSTLERSFVQGTTRKPHKQKGTGRARQGSLRSPQFRGGGIVFGPRVRSHAIDLPKKIRQQGLCMALADKWQHNSMVCIENYNVNFSKTREFQQSWHKMVQNCFVEDRVFKSVLFVKDECSEMFLRTTRNIHLYDVLCMNGLNVYDILRHDLLVLTPSVVTAIKERLG